VDLFDLLLGPHQDQERVRRVAKGLAQDSGGDRRSSDLARKALSETGFLGLGLLSLVQLLVEKGLITREQFLQRLARLDELDGARDGRISQEALLAALGIERRPAAEPPPAPAGPASAKGIPMAKVVKSGPLGGAKPAAPERRESKTASWTDGRSHPEAAASPRLPAEVPARKQLAPTPAPAPAPEAHAAEAKAEPQAHPAPVDPAALGRIAFEDYFGKEGGEKK
jgi:hypothetical protein